MTALTTKSSLSEAQRWLVEVMQWVNFGRIEDLYVREGEPARDPAPRIFRKVKCGGDNAPRPEVSSADFWLKNQAIDLFESFAEIGNGKIIALEIKGGLPFAFEVEVTGSASGTPGERLK